MTLNAPVPRKSAMLKRSWTGSCHVQLLIRSRLKDIWTFDRRMTLYVVCRHKSDIRDLRKSWPIKLCSSLSRILLFRSSLATGKMKMWSRAQQSMGCTLVGYFSPPPPSSHKLRTDTRYHTIICSRHTRAVCTLAQKHGWLLPSDNWLCVHARWPWAKAKKLIRTNGAFSIMWQGHCLSWQEGTYALLCLRQPLLNVFQETKALPYT